jgi:hypothetical protein
LVETFLTSILLRNSGMIVNLQRMLDGLDPSRGDRLDDPELENMYQKVVELQPQIVSLMKKYADQRGESFFRPESRRYERVGG